VRRRRRSASARRFPGAAERIPRKDMRRIGGPREPPRTSRSPFGMFDRPLFAYGDFPSSLHFASHSISSDGAVAGPSSHALNALSILHASFLGRTFGTKQGCYGAGGGGVHAMYLGRPPEDASSAFPEVAVLLDMLHLSEPYRTESMRWMTTADPVHQHLFPRYRDDEMLEEYEAGNEDCASVPSLEALAGVLVDSIPTRRIVAPDRIPSHVTANYPSLVHGRIRSARPRLPFDDENSWVPRERNLGIDFRDGPSTQREYFPGRGRRPRRTLLKRCHHHCARPEVDGGHRRPGTPVSSTVSIAHLRS